MKRIFTLILFVCSFSIAKAQAPIIVKSVGGTNMEPYSTAKEYWINNHWNGLFFYQGKGTPTKLAVTDGSNAGTKFLLDIGAGTIHKILPAKDFVYVITIQTVSFSPFTYRYQIWKTDGTASGTVLIYTLPDAVGISNGAQFCSDPVSVFNYSIDGTSNTFYFSAYDAVNGNELWVTDGTAAGTHIVKDIKAGIGGSFPWGFFKIGNDVFFNCTEIGFERKLWKTDGTAAGTVQVSVAEPFYIVNGSIGKMGNKMIFFAHNTAEGYEPYVSDGTAAGTFMLANINAGSSNSLLSYVEEANLKSNKKFCFLILQNGVDTSLYRTDGSTAGTVRVAPVGMSVYTGISTGGYSDVDENGIWIVKYNSGGSGNAESIYRSDGSMAGTYMVAENISYGQKVKIYKNALWMQARNIGTAANVEPWRSGGNAGTTNKAFEIDPGTAPSPTFTPFSSNPHSFFVKNGKLYFFATPVMPSGHNLYEYTGDFTFNGSQAGGRWRDSANWNGMMPPGITDTAYVNAGTANTLNIDGSNAYAGVLNLGTNATIHFTASTDSLVLNSTLNANGNNSITGTGVLALRNINATDTVKINGAFSVSNVALQSNSSLLSGTATVTNNINLLAGKIILNNNHLLLSGNSSTINNTANNYVVTNGTGSLQIEDIGTGGRAAEVVFPIGTSFYYNPAYITNAGNTDVFSARTITGIYGNYTGESPTGQQYIAGVVGNTWLINEGTAGGSNATIKLQWNASQELPGFNRTQSYLGHYTLSAWSIGTAGNAAGTDPYTFERSGISSFSPFGIMNNNGTLPLRFLSFSVQECNTKNICLNWKTGSEQNISHFEIERSKDGISYTSIGVATAGGNNYNYEDKLTDWSNRQLFYRIKEIDTDGKIYYSKVVGLKKSEAAVQVYPTLVKNYFTVQNSGTKQHLLLVDALGKIILQQWLQPGTNHISTAQLIPGIYFYIIASETNMPTIKGKIVKQ